VAALESFADDEAADEARSSCDQYSHRFVLFLGAKLNYFGAKVANNCEMCIVHCDLFCTFAAKLGKNDQNRNIKSCFSN
jgi:hypothetical protein